jgi:hypothetical protein
MDHWDNFLANRPSWSDRLSDDETESSSSFNDVSHMIQNSIQHKERAFASICWKGNSHKVNNDLKRDQILHFCFQQKEPTSQRVETIIEVRSVSAVEFDLLTMYFVLYEQSNNLFLTFFSLIAQLLFF